MGGLWIFMRHSLRTDHFGVISQRALNSSRNKKWKLHLKGILLKEWMV